MIAQFRKTRMGAVIISMCLLFSWSGAGLAAKTVIVPISYYKLDSERSRAAAKALNKIQQQSFDNQSEYCGVLYLYGKEVVASKPTKGDQASCGIGLARYENYKVVATYHTHGRHDLDYDNEVPSSQDLRSSEATSLDDYVSTPGGRLWLVSAKQQAVFKICDLKCLQQDTRFEECAEAVPRNQYDGDGLRSRNRVIGSIC